ncbi:MAG TPA: hypothetical protein VNV66_13000 [Pilimelia sp.]|nr:hypothetical protein [Pilimelia sp.]
MRDGWRPAAGDGRWDGQQPPAGDNRRAAGRRAGSAPAPAAATWCDAARAATVGSGRPGRTSGAGRARRQRLDPIRWPATVRRATLVRAALVAALVAVALPAVRAAQPAEPAPGATGAAATPGAAAPGGPPRDPRPGAAARATGQAGHAPHRAAPAAGPLPARPMAGPTPTAGSGAGGERAAPTPDQGAPGGGTPGDGPQVRLRPPTGTVGVAVAPADPAVVALLRPGDRVDLLATLGRGRVVTVAADATVLAVGPASELPGAAVLVALSRSQARDTAALPAGARLTVVLRA